MQCVVLGGYQAELKRNPEIMDVPSIISISILMWLNKGLTGVALSAQRESMSSPVKEKFDFSENYNIGITLERDADISDDDN